MTRPRGAVFSIVLLSFLSFAYLDAWGQPGGKLGEWPTTPLRPYDIVALSDNSVWLTVYEESADAGELRYVGRVFTIDLSDPADVSPHECVANRPAEGAPIAEEDRVQFQTLAAAADDTLWIADKYNRIWHFVPSGCDDVDPSEGFEPFALPVTDRVDDATPRWQFPASCQPYGVSVASDGIIWFACDDAPHIGRFDPLAARDEDRWRRFDFPADHDPPLGKPKDIAVDDDGNVWFTIEKHASVAGVSAGLGRLTPGVDSVPTLWTDFGDLPDGCFPYGGEPFTLHGISVVDGMVWFVDHSNSSLLSFDPDNADFDCIPFLEEGGPHWDTHFFAKDRLGFFWLTAFAENTVIIADPDTGEFDWLALDEGVDRWPMGITASPSGAIWWAETFETTQGGVGRFLPLYILQPTEDQPAWAANSSGGNRVWVRLACAEELDLSRANLQVEIGGEPMRDEEGERIVLHSAFESETWLVLDLGRRDAGCYDLTVSLGEPVGVRGATAPDSLCYGEEGAHLIDRVIAVDRTGSMLYNSETGYPYPEKMQAAREAASLIVDVSNTGDGIGLISFQLVDENNDYTVQREELTKLEHEFSFVDLDGPDVSEGIRWEDITPSPANWAFPSETSIGAAIARAWQELDDHGQAGALRHIILVTDGRENYPPYWEREGAGGPLKPGVLDLEGDIEEDLTIHTVGIGEDAELGVLEDIATSTHGFFMPLHEGEGSYSLRSRLTTAFKAFDEDVRGEQRFYYQEGVPESTAVGGDLIPEVRFTVEPNLDWMTVTFHWVNSSAEGVTLIGPDDAVAAPLTETDDRHTTYRIFEPAAGEWRYQVPGTINLDGEFTTIASAPTSLTARLVMGETIKGDDGVWSTPIRIWIAEDVAVSDATVTAVITRPDRSKTTETLRDDGASSDGGEGDGVYGFVAEEAEPGGYLVEVTATGDYADAEPFDRYMVGSFVIPGRPTPPPSFGEGRPGGGFCGGSPLCCWLWAGFVLAYVLTLIALLWLVCYFRTSRAVTSAD
jgi:streptogramin lyase